MGTASWLSPKSYPLRENGTDLEACLTGLRENPAPDEGKSRTGVHNGQEEQGEAAAPGSRKPRCRAGRGFLFTRPAKWGLRTVGLEVDAY